MAVSISISIKQNSQNVANNTSNVTISVTASWTGGSWNLSQKSGWLKVNDDKWDFTSSFNDSQTSSGSKVIYTRTGNVAHNNDGTLTLNCSASYTTGVSSGTVTASASKKLTTIPRKSSWSQAANGTLGTAQTLKISRNSTTFKHRILYSCGTASGYIAGSSTTYSSATSFSWTPPISLASQNTTGTSVSIKLTLGTYDANNNALGSVSKTITCTIPSSVKPSCTVTVTDTMGYESTYGGFIKGISKFHVVVKPTTSYGSAIASYSTTANGSTYNTASFDTGVVKTVGTNTIKATVKDKRGRTGTASVSKTVLDYTNPTCTLNVKRCTQDGTEDIQGGYIKATFSSNVTSLNSKNKATYSIAYKKTSAATYGTPVLSTNSSSALYQYNNVYSVTNGTFIFPAETDSSYNVQLIVTDNFSSSTPVVKNASSAFALMHWRADGTGMSIGKLAELGNAFDVGIKTCIRKDLYVGSKTSYMDGNVGIFAAGEGYIHIQRAIDNVEEKWPYIGFLSNNSTNVETRIVYDGECMNFWGGNGFNFNRDIVVENASKQESLLQAKNTKGAVSLLINNSRGIYDHTTSSWLIYRNSGTSTDTFIPSKLGVSGNLEAGTNVSGTESKLGLFGGKSDIFLFSRQSSDTTTVQWGIYDSVGGHMLTYTGNLHIYPRIYTKESIVLPNNMTVSGYDSNGTARIMLKMSDADTVNLGNTVCVTRLYGKSVYLNGTSTAVTSDERVKKDFVELDRYMDFFKKLNPVGYKYLVGTSDRYHVGFKAGEVKTALEECGLTTQDFAGYVEEDIDKEFYMDTLGYVPFEGKESALRYSEFIALNTYAIQNLLKEVERLKGELSKWTNQSA